MIDASSPVDAVSSIAASGHEVIAKEVAGTPSLCLATPSGGIATVTSVASTAVAAVGVVVVVVVVAVVIVVVVAVVVIVEVVAASVVVVLKGKEDLTNGMYEQ